MLKKNLFLLFIVSLFAGNAVATSDTPKQAAAADEETKEQYVEIVENKLKTWDQITDRVQEGNYTDKDFQRRVSPAEAKKLAAELETHKNQVSELLTSLKRAEGTAWKNWRNRIQSHMGQMRKEFQMKAD